MDDTTIRGGGTELAIQSPSFSLRKIEFHPARKSYSFGNRHDLISSSDDFRIETLNPDDDYRLLHKMPPPRLLLNQSGGKKVDGLDPDQLSLGFAFRRIGAGLENPHRKTCFLNSVLQCLTYTEPLTAYLQSGKHNKNTCRIVSGTFCAVCSIQNHVSVALKSTGESIHVPNDLVSNFRCTRQEEDAHEFMVHLLQSMHKCCLPLGVQSESNAAYEKSLVHKIFGGRLRSQVECQECMYRSNKYDPFLDLSLEINKANTLQVALRNFTAAELLDDGGEKQYQCQQCKHKVSAKKRLTVDKSPYVLTIHLKRFYALDPGGKVDKKVTFDRSLDMKPFVSSDSYEGDLKYSLYGVIVHLGHNTHTGHYVCYVRTSIGIWYLLNDKVVRQVSEKDVLEQNAYMLFYVRDRKKIVAPIIKPVHDVVYKENMIRATVEQNGCLDDDKVPNCVLGNATIEKKSKKKRLKKHRRSTSSNLRFGKKYLLRASVGLWKKKKHNKKNNNCCNILETQNLIKEQFTPSSTEAEPSSAAVPLLTRGLEETTNVAVARWDGLEELSCSQMMESSRIEVGHVLDEWDEEYDRGKRKKLRIKQHEFRGSNPFQEIAIARSIKKNI